MVHRKLRRVKTYCWSFRLEGITALPANTGAEVLQGIGLWLDPLFFLITAAL
jgi:hypothetical protein